MAAEANTRSNKGGFDPVRLERMQEIMAGHVGQRGVPGLVTMISRRGEVHAHVYGTKATGGTDPMRHDTIFRIASISKPIVSAAAMILLEECKLRLEDPVDEWLPELANLRVLRQLDSPLNDTIPARRAITVRDVLTYRLGTGFTLEMFNGEFAIVNAITETMGPIGPVLPDVTPDEYMRRLSTLPLIFQPGERFLYNTAGDVLGVLIARVTGQELGVFLRDRLFDPLGMKDTGFCVPAEKLDRLPAVYQRNHATGEIGFFDDPENSRWGRPPAFPSGAGGLVSTADDLLAFSKMMLNGGKYGDVRILSRPAVELMTTNQLTDAQKAGGFLTDDAGWGFGLSVVLKRGYLFATPGRFGWDGGYGTSWAVDPAEEMIGILLTQMLWDAPRPPAVCSDFWNCAYAAIGD